MTSSNSISWPRDLGQAIFVAGISLVLPATPLLAAGCSRARVQEPATSPVSVVEPGDQAARSTMSDGANCLFIGHSFFIPVAKSFDEVAARNDFPAHQADFVFASGKGGSPSSLWDNRRRRSQIEEKLATGDIDLLGMTTFAPRQATTEHFQRWIDLALKHNPETRFFIGQPWAPGGPKLETSRFHQSTVGNGDAVFQVVTRLRHDNPDTPIYYINYGLAAPLMKADFEAGELDDLDNLTGRRGDRALFRDQLMGHAGPMLQEVSALTWLDLLYGAKVEDLVYSPYDQSDVLSIVSEVTEHNDKYR
jgi:hypothetical protein